jgi:hypothetical protein
MTEKAKVKIDIEVGDDYYCKIGTTVPEGSEVAYFTGIAYGAVQGGANASDFLMDLLFPDADYSGLPNDLKAQVAASKATK